MTSVPKKPLVSAKSKAVSLLSRREHSQTELRAKLLQRGYESSEVDVAVQWAVSHQFQSDERFRLSLVRRRAATLGDRAISAELGQHGLAGFKVAELDSDLPDSFSLEEDRAFEWIRRRQGAALHDLFHGEDIPVSNQLLMLKAKVFRSLASRGFEFGNIDRAWQRIVAEFKSNA